MSAVSLVMGILGLVFAFIPVVNAFGVGIYMGILGIVMGAIAKKKGNSGAATAGLVLSILATVFAVIFWFACGGYAACFGSAVVASGM